MQPTHSLTCTHSSPKIIIIVICLGNQVACCVLIYTHTRDDWLQNCNWNIARRVQRKKRREFIFSRSNRKTFFLTFFPSVSVRHLMKCSLSFIYQTNNPVFFFCWLFEIRLFSVHFLHSLKFVQNGNIFSQFSVWIAINCDLLSFGAGSRAFSLLFPLHSFWRYWILNCKIL